MSGSIPLQQLLVVLPGGHLQASPIAERLVESSPSPETEDLLERLRRDLETEH